MVLFYLLKLIFSLIHHQYSNFDFFKTIYVTLLCKLCFTHYENIHISMMFNIINSILKKKKKKKNSFLLIVPILDSRTLVFTKLDSKQYKSLTGLIKRIASQTQIQNIFIQKEITEYMVLFRKKKRKNIWFWLRISCRRVQEMFILGKRKKILALL